MGERTTYEDAGRAQRIKTVLGEIVEDVVRIKNEATHLLDRIIRLEDSMRMMVTVAGKMEARSENGPPNGKTRDNIDGPEGGKVI